MPAPIGSSVIHAYLDRLGLDPEPPSAAALDRLHRAHVERVPYETLWIHLGQGWDVDPAASMYRIAHQGRGGYCYHLNGAFATLLLGLGYEVTLHAGGVFGPSGPAADDIPNHLVLTVHGLPTDSHPGGDWYVDAGLGDAMHKPMPLREVTQDQEPFRFSLMTTHGAAGDWQFTHDRAAGSFAGMVWRAAPVGMDTFAARHRVLSTAPESRFVQVLTAQRRDASGVDVLRGRILRHIGIHATESTIDSRVGLVEVLTDLFGIDLRVVEDAHLDALWDRVQRSHEEWLAGST